MTLTNGDIRYTDALKKEKSSSLRDVSRRKIHSRRSLIYLVFFFASLCLFYFNIVYFQYMHFYFEHNKAQPIPADSGPIIIWI